MLNAGVLQAMPLHENLIFFHYRIMPTLENDASGARFMLGVP